MAAQLYGYNTHSESERQEMLHAIGLETIDDLFGYIPENLRLDRSLDLPSPLSEWELDAHIHEIAHKNSTTKTHSSFLGGGMYQHYIPSAIDALLQRSEFLTSYTPYQPEMSQGLLQALYEYQTAMSSITGKELVNGSCYDGTTAFADAAWVSCCIAEGEYGKSPDTQHMILVAETVSPTYRKVLETYMEGRPVTVHTVSANRETGQIDPTHLASLCETLSPSGFLVQSPNRFGILEDTAELIDVCKDQNVVSTVSWNPVCSGLLTPPGIQGADIVTGEGQPFGIPLSAGGPSLGIFATDARYRAYIPGRLVGEVLDLNGNPAYALVAEEREQHVAREKATSNICSNQASNALRAVLYLSLLGEKGLEKVASLSVQKARYVYGRLIAVPGIRPAFAEKQAMDDFFHEFTILLPVACGPVLEKLHERGIFGGIDVSQEYKEITGKSGDVNALLIAVTEVKSKDALDYFVANLTEIISETRANQSIEEK